MYGAQSVFSHDKVLARAVLPTHAKRVNNKMTTGGPSVRVKSVVDKEHTLQETDVSHIITESTKIANNTGNIFWLAPETDITITLPHLVLMTNDTVLSWRNYGSATATIMAANVDSGDRIAVLNQDQTLFIAANIGNINQWRILLGPINTMGYDIKCAECMKNKDIVNDHNLQIGINEHNTQSVRTPIYKISADTTNITMIRDTHLVNESTTQTDQELIIKEDVESLKDISMTNMESTLQFTENIYMTIKFDAITSVNISILTLDDIVCLSIDSITQKTIKGRLVLKSIDQLPEHIRPSKPINLPVYIIATEIYDLARLRITPDGFIELTGPNPERGTIRYTWDPINVHYLMC
jgi:hypothetical protein